MYKKLCFLISFVVVLSVCGTTQAQTDINVVNWSFEMVDDVNQVTCHMGLGNAPNEDVWGWTGGAWPGSLNPTWSGVDVNCGVAGMCDDCRDWHVFPDGNVVAYFDMGTFGYQLTDQDITAGHMYTMTADLMTWAEEGYSQPIRLQLYYIEDPNYPDANHVILADKVYMVEGYQMESCAGTPGCLDDWQYDQELKWVAQEGQAYDLDKLGIKIGSPPASEYTGSSWAWGDRVRLNWKWASAGYDPSPGDAETNVSKNPTLCWTPGLWTATTLGHQVYFGTDEAAVTDANTNSPEYTGAPQDSNCFTPTGPLELGKTYYWRVDEVNSAYSGPLPPPWIGDTWSFEITGYATNPSPYSGETDIPYLDQSLIWTAGTDATSHDVYFGSDEDEVADANTNSSEFKDNQALGDTDLALPALDVSTTYYWRIDELSAVHPNGLKGKVWNFTVGEFLILDDFDQYANIDDLYDVWDDYYVNDSDAELGLQTGDMNYIRGGEGKSMQIQFANTSQTGAPKYFIGSWVDCQDLTELEAGGDWSIGGVKALTLYLIGDPCNRPHVGEYKDNPLVEIIAPWVEVEDTSSNIGFVAYDSPTNMFYDYQWFEWNIDLAIFDACGVTLSAIDRLTIGFGGDRVGQADEPTEDTKAYVHIDDLRLYPARCIAELAGAAGNITEGDCTIDNFDMQIMADDWLIADGCFPTSTANATLTMLAGDPNWTTGHINNALGFDPNIEVDVCNPGLFGLTNMSITAWVRREGEPIEGYIGVVTCREKLIEDSTELACGAKATAPEVAYCWNQITATWQFDSAILIPDGEWMLMAMAVDPTGCQLYGGPAGGTLESIRHEIELGPLEQFDHRYWIGRGRADSRYFTGKIDDVRIFTKTLDAYEMQWLHTGGVDGNDPGCPAYHHKFDESSGLTAADDGCGAVVYRPVMSPANLTDPEPILERFVNFRDFDIMATNWLEEYLWPPQ